MNADEAISLLGYCRSTLTGADLEEISDIILSQAARIAELEALRCKNSEARTCAKEWEASHQTRALAEYNLAEEFPFGCDSIQHVAEALVSARVRIAELEGALKECGVLIEKAVLAEQCPDCDNTGCYAVSDRHGDPEPMQCEFCYTVPWSKFNVNRLKEQVSILMEKKL